VYEWIEQSKLSEEFERVTASLRTAAPIRQGAVARKIDSAKNSFLKRFVSVAAFRELSKGDKLQYVGSLTRAEANRGGKDPDSEIAIALFAMWVAILAENDSELEDKFTREFASLSMKL